MRYLDKLEEAKVDQGMSYPDKRRARAKRAFDAAYEDAKTSGKGKAGEMMRSIDFRKTKVMAARDRRRHGDPEQPLARQVEVENNLKKKLKAEAYIHLGDVLAEAITEDKAEENFRKREATRKIIGNMNAKSAAADAKIPKPAPKPGVRTRIANKLDNFSREQFTRGESDEASGKEWLASIRGTIADRVGRVSQKVRPKDEG